LAVNTRILSIDTNYFNPVTRHRNWCVTCVAGEHSGLSQLLWTGKHGLSHHHLCLCLCIGSTVKSIECLHFKWMSTQSTQCVYLSTDTRPCLLSIGLYL